MSIDRIGWPAGHEDETTREMRSGLSGLGGRPALHPAWREAAEPRLRAAAANAPRTWLAFGLPPAGTGEDRLAA